MEIRLNDRTAESQFHLVGAHSRIHTCWETKLHEYFHISIWSEHFEQRDFSTEVKERLNGNPECQSSGESLLSSQVQMFVRDIFAASPREGALTFQSGVPPSTSKKAKGQKYQLSYGNSKFQNVRICLSWYKNPRPNVVYIWFPLHHLMGNWGKKNQHELHCEVIKGLISDAETSRSCYRERE